MSYQLKIDAKSKIVARYISSLQKQIQAALVASGMSQQQVAEKLGVDRSVVNRRLKGKANLTARSIAEFAYALEKEAVTTFTDKTMRATTNHQVTTRSAGKDYTTKVNDVTRGTYKFSSSPHLETVAS